jgi:hypothetical protein
MRDRPLSAKTGPSSATIEPVFFTLRSPCMKKLLPCLVLLAVSIGLSGCDPCGNEVSQTVVSPSGRLKAVVFNRDCGATTGFSTQVSIIPSSESLPGEGGNTIVLDGTVPLKIEWRSDSMLHLSGIGAARIFLQPNSAAGVSVSYVG